MSREQHLDELTDRWRARRAMRREARARALVAREAADPGRVERASNLFPYRETTPAGYLREHGSAMTAYTYDDYTYPDVELQAWLDELGRLLRLQPSPPDR